MEQLSEKHIGPFFGFGILFAWMYSESLVGH